MQLITDLHIHSKYSRATSPTLDLQNLEKWAKLKGVHLLGTGDFTHPIWIKELKVLEEQNGILKTKTGFPFIWQTEISLIYTQDNKGRRIHLLVFAPNYEVVSQITDYLKSKGRIDYDGRPIFGISCIDFTEKLKSISKDIEIIPAHAWTPWFGVLGSKGGFNTLEQAFQDQVKHIHAIETGLSSDPEMNWRYSKMDKFALLSFSDLHSYWPWRLGREATVFDLNELSYEQIIKNIREKTFKETIEVDPNYGKYHLDGHRNCHVCLEPKESNKLNKICPKCKKELTIGVLNRIEELADRPEGYKPQNAIPFKRLLPLTELIANTFSFGLNTKTCWTEYWKLIKAFKDEYNILLNVPLEKLKTIIHPKLAENIIKNRLGQIKIKPGYDGEYGEPQLDKAQLQKRLGDFS
ncbi:MAG: DNA helicase UvrD [Nanoarchaeota archaeon]|nr:DNA helicase UvrD [Nanoarchaeota archaeon]